MSTQPDSRQIKKRSALTNLGTAANATVESILDNLNTEANSPLRMYASSTPDAKLNFASSSLSRADAANMVASPVKKQVFSALSSPWINFQTQAVSNAADFDITWPTPNTVGRYRNVGFTLIGSGKIKVLFSAEAVSEGALSNPGALFINGGLPIGYITLQCTDTLGYFKTSASITNIIENNKIFRLAAGGGASSSGTGSGSGGGELADLMYKAAIRDSFTDIPDGTTTVDITSGKTDVTLHDVANELFKINYDASRTVTGTGTSMTLSGTPAFTVKQGDILIVGSESRRISALASQTSYTIESPFTTDPSAAVACVSQAIYTVNLNTFDNGGLGLSASSQFTGNIDEIMLGYADTETVGDIIPNFGSAPVIAFSASTDTTSWTTNRTRVTSLASSEAIVTCPTSSTGLYIRFFANKTSGSGSVNLLSYKVFFHKEIGQIAGAQYYTAFARPTSSIAQNCTIGLVGGKTRFKFSFPYTRGLNPTEASGSVLEVIANGQVIPRYTAGVTDDNQAYFKEIDDNTIEMDADYSNAGIDFQFKVQRVGIIDNNTQNTSKVALHDDLLDQTLEAQVIPLFRSAVNGTPSNTQFRSDITNRANIPDLSSMLSVQMGVQRMMTQEIYPIQNEFGPAGQPVFGAVNDKFNQIRFVGGWTALNDTYGQKPWSAVGIGDYVEIVFYGTGLNALTNCDNNSVTRDWRVSIDGGSEGSNIYLSTYSNVIGNRNYSSNAILPIVSGLSLGFHTIKIRQNAAQGMGFFGFEVLTETTSLRVMPGTVVKGKYKNSLSALQTIAHDSSFESGALGAKGGCVLVYLKTDGTIGKAVTPTDTTALYLTNANHANEEIVRAYSPLEFGAGRSDDFSLVRATANLAFTLDDGVTTLVGSSVDVISGAGILRFGTNNNFATITFVGTGLDILRVDTGSTSIDAYSVTIDGVVQGTLNTALITTPTVVKICSGLPYGTHTVKFSFGTIAASGRLCINQFIVYAPKKPSLPVGAIELAQYYKVADFVANATSGIDYIATGVIRKTNVREAVYSGTWSISAVAPTNYAMGFATSTVTNGGYAEFTFFGTGFDYRFFTDPTYTSSATITINGLTANLTNFPAMISSLVGPATFNTSTGVLAQNVTNGSGRGLRISGLPLALYKVRITNNTTSGLDVANFDAISPIHAPTLNGPYVVQNTLSLGNNGFLDLRKFNKKDVSIASLNKTFSAIIISANPTTTSTTLIPVPDMSLTYNSEGEMVDIFGAISEAISIAGGISFLAIFMNGQQISTLPVNQTGIANQNVQVTVSKSIYLPKGQYKFDLYSKVNGGTGTYDSRQLIVKKAGVV